MSELGGVLGAVRQGIEDVPHPQRAGGARSTNPKIEHVVVLVLEDRSFDHMLGYLRSQNPKIDGPLGVEFKYADPTTQSGMTLVSSDAPYVPDVDPSPTHEFHDVMLQLFAQFTEPNPVPPDGTNMGFMYDYAKVSHNVAHAGKVMRCFAPDRLPVLHILARAFAICDHWFSSLPGPTWPNLFSSTARRRAATLTTQCATIR